jgi:hypothetical protein
MLDDILSNVPDNPKLTEDSEDAEASGIESPVSEEPAEEDELISDSEWLGTFATDGSHFEISDVTKSSFRFEYQNQYTEEYAEGKAKLDYNRATYSNLEFWLEGDVLKVFMTKSPAYFEDEDETGATSEAAASEEDTSVEYWRAFAYTEIDPRPLEEDENMVPQDIALKTLDQALPRKVEDGLFLEPVGAVDIEGELCWAFALINRFEQVFTGIVNYAVSNDGAVFVRNDYLSKYVIQPYALLEF